ncbi:MAG: hypothetical protein LBG44_04330 [Gemmatimonadota bacterium]|jgi:hypothetical protein|nr:hypothetical protein [Gemmatimonadota bacterium]
MRSTTRFTDWAYLLAAAFSIALLVLAIVFFWRPAGSGHLAPSWWMAVVMGVLFFMVLGLGYNRKRTRTHAALHQALAETRAEIAAEKRSQAKPAPPPSSRGKTNPPPDRKGKKSSGN